MKVLVIREYARQNSSLSFQNIDEYEFESIEYDHSNKCVTLSLKEEANFTIRTKMITDVKDCYIHAGHSVHVIRNAIPE